MIQDFPINPAVNVSGNFKFEFALPSALSQFPAVLNSAIALALAFNGGERFYKGYSTLETLDFNEDAVESEQGTYYKQSITGFVPGNSSELTALFALLEKARWMVMITDQQNQKRLVGLYTPMKCIAKFASGKAPGESKGFAFEFSAESIARAPVYMG